MFEMLTAVYKIKVLATVPLSRCVLPLYTLEFAVSVEFTLLRK